MIDETDLWNDWLASYRRRAVELMTDLELWADSEGNHPDGLRPLAMRLANPAQWVYERQPETCANGHALAPPNYRGSWLPCTCAGPEHGHGHRVVGCVECGHEWFYPPHTDTTATAQHWASETKASTE